MLSMDITMLSGRAIVNKLTRFIDWLSQEHQPDVSSQPGDILYQEIRQIEQALVDVSTRPSSIVRKLNKSLGPMTEQEKIIDLSG